MSDSTMTAGDFDEVGDLRRIIEGLNIRLDKQAERDAKLTHERNVLAMFARHGEGDLNEVRRIVDEALGDRVTRSLDAAMRRKMGGKP